MYHTPFGGSPFQDSCCLCCPGLGPTTSSLAILEISSEQIVFIVTKVWCLLLMKPKTFNLSVYTLWGSAIYKVFLVKIFDSHLHFNNSECKYSRKPALITNYNLSFLSCEVDPLPCFLLCFFPPLLYIMINID